MSDTETMKTWVLKRFSLFARIEPSISGVGNPRLEARVLMPNLQEAERFLAIAAHLTGALGKLYKVPAWRDAEYRATFRAAEAAKLAIWMLEHAVLPAGYTKEMLAVAAEWDPTLHVLQKCKIAEKLRKLKAG